MNSEEKKIKIKSEREKLIRNLERVYKNAFDELSDMKIEEGSIAKLSQAFLKSREAAMNELNKEIEKQIITTSPKSGKEIKN